MADAEGVQQELQDYLHKKGINTLFINLVESLLLAKPDNPILHIIQYLQTNYPADATPRKKDAPHLHSDDNPASPRHNHSACCLLAASAKPHDAVGLLTCCCCVQTTRTSRTARTRRTATP